MAKNNEMLLRVARQEEQPSRLTPSEKAQPEKVIADFFNFTTLSEARNCLSNWLSASFKAQNGEQFEYIHLWQQLERLIEANWLLHNQSGESAEETL